MATSQVEERSDLQLKHLGFVRIAAINAVVLVSNLYEYAKQKFGSLNSTVGKIENNVSAVVGPVYQKFKGVPSDILVFLDKKVDEAANKFDECAPPAAKMVVYKAQLIVKKASQVVQDLAEEAKVEGPLAAISHAGKISRSIVVCQIAVVWYKANQYPALHGVFETAGPAAAHLSEKYNKLVKELSAKGYSVFNYVPLIPVEEMSKAYKQVESAACKKEEDKQSSSGSDSDKE